MDGVTTLRGDGSDNAHIVRGSRSSPAYRFSEDS